MAPTRTCAVVPSVRIVTSNWPGWPAIFWIVEEVWTRTFWFAFTSRRSSSRGLASISRYGGRWGNEPRAFFRNPPSWASFSTRTTGWPARAASAAAVRPLIPPPTTRRVLSISAWNGWGTSALSARARPMRR